MKELNSYDRANAAFLNVITPEWRQVKAARSATTPVRAPDVAIALRFQTIAGRKIRIAEAGPTDAPVVVLLSPFPLSILTFAPAWTALTATVRVLANLDSPPRGGPLIAGALTLGSVRHQPSAQQIDDYLTCYQGRVGDVLQWFDDFDAKRTALANLLSRIDTPTMVFWGEHDAYLPVENATLINTALDGELHIMKDSGHLSWADAPEEFASFILDWVNTATS